MIGRPELLCVTAQRRIAGTASTPVSALDCSLATEAVRRFRQRLVAFVR